MIAMSMHYYSVIPVYEEPPKLEIRGWKGDGGLVGFPIGTNNGGS
jgi:hypothetical protein